MIHTLRIETPAYIHPQLIRTASTMIRTACMIIPTCLLVRAREPDRQHMLFRRRLIQPIEFRESMSTAGETRWSSSADIYSGVARVRCTPNALIQRHVPNGTTDYYVDFFRCCFAHIVVENTEETTLGHHIHQRRTQKRCPHAELNNRTEQNISFRLVVHELRYICSVLINLSNAWSFFLQHE